MLSNGHHKGLEEKNTSIPLDLKGSIRGLYKYAVELGEEISLNSPEASRSVLFIFRLVVWNMDFPIGGHEARGTHWDLDIPHLTHGPYHSHSCSSAFYFIPHLANKAVAGIASTSDSAVSAWDTSKEEARSQPNLNTSHVHKS